MDNEKKTIFWDASEIFTQLTDSEFKSLVLPFIKAYYKHKYEGELYLQSTDDTRDLVIIVNCNRNESKITYYFDIEDCENSIENCIENDLKNLKAKDIYNYLLYEYKLLFKGDELIKNKQKKEIML